MSATVAEHAAPPAKAGRVGMWLFLISDAFSFAALLAVYGVLRLSTKPWRDPALHEPALAIADAALLTLVLAASSATMALARAAADKGDRRAAARWLRITILGGLLFLAGQYHEWFGLWAPGLAAEGLHFGASHYASTFFVITGFHGAHVLGGVIYLSGVLARVTLDDASPELDYVATAGLYWHFVDVVWMLVFVLVYLV